MSTEKVKVRITKSQIETDRENGLTIPEIAKKYDIALSDVRKLLKLAGLDKSRPKAKASFEFIDDSNPDTTVKEQEVPVVDSTDANQTTEVVNATEPVTEEGPFSNN